MQPLSLLIHTVLSSTRPFEGVMADQRCWLQPLGPAAQTQHEKLVFWKRRQKEKKQQDPLHLKSKQTVK